MKEIPGIGFRRKGTKDTLCDNVAIASWQLMSYLEEIESLPKLISLI